MPGRHTYRGMRLEPHPLNNAVLMAHEKDFLFNQYIIYPLVNFLKIGVVREKSVKHFGSITALSVLGSISVSGTKFLILCAILECFS